MKGQTWIPILSEAGTRTEAGMTLVQFLILVAITAVFAVLCVPPWLENRWVSQADVDVEVIAEAIQKYHKHTNQYPKTLLDLVTNPGIEGWRYPYLERVPKTPWRGEYDLLPEIYKVCVGKDNTSVPEKYQLGGISEISRVYLEGKEAIKYWWRTE